jgi:primosomal protein N' (replication factor Y)
MNTPVYVDVVLPLALRFALTYSVDSGMASSLQTGMRVVVPLKGGKLYTGLIWRIHHTPPEDYEIKPVAEVLDNEPVILPIMQPFWEKMAAYYMATLGEVMTAALPAGLKLESKARFCLRQDADIYHTELSDREYLLAEAMETQGSITVEDAEKILGLKHVRKYLKNLLDKGLIASAHEMEERYKPLMKKGYRLQSSYRLEENLKKALDSMSRATKQTEMLTHFLILSGHFTGEEKPVAREALLEGNPSGAAALKALIKKGLLEEFEEEAFRIQLGELREGNDLPELTPKQKEALAQSRTYLEERKPVLLFGLTGSGKTEVYIHLIREALDKGKQVLFLLPEIALTTQLIERIKRIFPGRVGVYHSKFSENERVEVWNRVLRRNGFDIVLGARSALFLPFSDLGLIVVDEEHEHSFKQYDPAPRYQARDFALVLAGLHQAPIILGSATPSLESYHNAMNRKYGLVKLEERFGTSVLPDIIPVNLAEARKKKELRTHFTLPLLEAMDKAIKQKQQAILFRNRRGFSLLLECRDCGHVPQCKNCDISLTYHKAIHQLRCRYCGYMAQVPTRCGACGGKSLEMQGFGTEKIEEELNLLHPEWRIARLDLDTASRKNAYARILGDFADRQTDVLVGTQMVSKGLDFDHVAIVGILHADEMLSIPDFRSNERAFQLMTQVSGRAGRREKKGLVLLQTYKPDHYVVKYTIEHDVAGFLNEEAHHRHKLGYPPFTRLIRITLRHTDKNYAQAAAETLAHDLRHIFRERVLGPEPPGVGRVRNKFLFDLLLKFKPDENLNKAKMLIMQATDRLHILPSHRSAEVLFDVDPY